MPKASRLIDLVALKNISNFDHSIPINDFMSLRPIVNSPLGQFAFESIRPLLDNSPFGQFALLSIRPQTDNSPFSQWGRNGKKTMRKYVYQIYQLAILFSLTKTRKTQKQSVLMSEQNELILHKIFFQHYQARLPLKLCHCVLLMHQVQFYFYSHRERELEPYWASAVFHFIKQ